MHRKLTRRGARTLDLFLLVPILLVGFFFRVFRLPELPNGMLWDEGAEGLEASRLFHGNFPIFFEGHSGHEPALLYLQALALKLFGWSAFSLRLPSVWMSMLGLAAAFILVRKLFNPRIAALASLLSAVAFWQVTMDRIGLRFTALPFLCTASAFWLVRAVSGRRTWVDALLSGLFLGLAMYTYTPARFMVFVIGGVWLAAYLMRPKERAALLRQGAILAAVAGAVFAPLAWYFVANPEQFSARAAELSIFNPAYGGAFRSWLGSARSAVLMFFVVGEHGWSKNIDGRPLFDPVMSALFIGGLAIAVMGLRRWRNIFILLWLVIMLVPLTLTAKDIPDFGRAIGIVPVVFVFPALAIDFVCGWRPRLWWLAGGGLMLLAVLSFHDYFVVWASSAERIAVYRPGVSEAANMALGRLIAPKAPARLYFGTRERYDAVTDFLVAGFQIEHPGVAFRLIGYDATDTVVLPPSGSESYLITPSAPKVTSLPDAQTALNTTLGGDLALEGYTLPAASRPGDTVHLQVRWEPRRPGTQSLTFFAHLVSFDQRRAVASIDENGFQPAQWQGGEQVLSVFPLTPPRETKPGAYWVQFGAYSGADNRRLQTPAGETQLLLGPLVVASGKPAPGPPIATLGEGIDLQSARADLVAGGLDVSLDWYPRQAQSTDYSVFVHLLDGSGRLVAQSDGTPDQGQWPTRYWMAGVPVHDEHLIAIPRNLPPGSYTVAVGLYRPESGQRLPSSVSGPEPDSALVESLHLPS